jgi:Tfp pilus assembly protein PilF
MADAYELIARATAASDAGEFARALQLLDAALASHAALAELHVARGWALENLCDEHLGAAREAYEWALALDARSLWAGLGLAGVLDRQGRHDAAMALFARLCTSALPRLGREPELMELRGWCQYRLGELDAAAASFQAALAVDAHWASVHFDLALVRLRQGDGAAALAHAGAGVQALRLRGLAARRGAVQVALDDLDDAQRAWPALAQLAQAGAMRSRLAAALAEKSEAAACDV